MNYLITESLQKYHHYLGDDFNEYFHNDEGVSIGASHQTGWTGLVAKLIQQQAEYDADSP